MPDPLVLKSRSGMVVAPAGCGKTQLIADALAAHAELKPILVLTHTNAGVASLRHRLDLQGVDRTAYRLATIDGWALRLVSTFPLRAEFPHGPAPLNPNYLEIRVRAFTLLRLGHVNDILRASYSRVLVDEYQDCSVRQHAIVGFLSNVLPTVLFGDPLQAIFGFGNDPLAEWENVLKHFPIIQELEHPWRWINAGEEKYGRWLLSIRQSLKEGRGIDLTQSPNNVEFVRLVGDAADHGRLVEAARCRRRMQGQKVLLIGDSMSAQSRHRIARNVPGVIAIEPVQLGDLVNFANTFSLEAPAALDKLVEFSGTIATNVGSPELLARLKSLCAGTAKKPATELEAQALRFCNAPTWATMAQLLVALTSQSGTRIYRPAVLRACLRAIGICAASSSSSFQEAVVQMREQYRTHGRQLPATAIGSTLLLKGLESDHVVVLNGGELDARNFYVALTRGARSATVCARNSALNPRL